MLVGISEAIRLLLVQKKRPEGIFQLNGSIFTTSKKFRSKLDAATPHSKSRLAAVPPKY
jgi:hypothetical protein